MDADGVNAAGVTETAIIAETAGTAGETVGGSLSDEQLRADVDAIAGATLNLFEREGRGIRIQGLGLARTELNGREVFTVPGGHALSWADVSREWMAGVDTVKTPDASMVEGGLGGTVNIRTKKPLANKNVNLFSVETRSGDLARQLDPKLAVLVGQQWQLGRGKLGLMLNGVAENSHRRQDSIRIQPWVKRTDLQQRDVYVPRGLGWNTRLVEQKQRTLSAGLQWQLDPSLEFMWQSLYSQYDIHGNEYGAGFSDGETALIPALNQEFSYDRNGAFSSGELWSQSWRGNVAGNGVRLNGTTKGFVRRNKTQEHTIGFSYAPAGDWAIKGDLQYIGASTKVLDLSVYTSTYIPDLVLDLSGTLPSYSTRSEHFLTQGENYFWNAAMDHLEVAEAEFFAGRLDSAKQLYGNAYFTALMMGARVSRDNSHIQDAGYNWGSLSDHWNLPLQTISSDGGGYAEYQTVENFFHGEADFLPAFYLPQERFVSNYAWASEVLPEQLKSGEPGTGWRANSFSFEDENTLQNTNAALYSMLLFENNTHSFGGLSGNIGVRVVGAQRKAMGYGEFKKLEDTGRGMPLEELSFADGSFYQLSESAASLHVLPSGYMRMNIAPEMVWRVAASRTLARPSYYQVKPYAQVWAETEIREDTDGESRAVVTRWLGRVGNPLLDPVRVQQYDSALEWQFSESGNVYSAVFYKQLAGAIERQIITEPFSNNGETRDVEVEKLINGGAAQIRGVEFGIRQRLGFLPGALRNVALQTTLTRISSQSNTELAGQALPMEGIAENNVSVSGTYQNKYFSTTFNYHWRDDLLQSSVDVNTRRPTWEKARGRLDASLALPLSHGVQLALEAQNLTNTVTKTEYGAYDGLDGEVDPLHHPSRWSTNERQWRLILRGQL